MGSHGSEQRLVEVSLERKMPMKALISRLLRYVLAHRKYLAVAILATITISAIGVITPYLLGREIISKFILRSDVSGLRVMIVAYVVAVIGNWIAEALRDYSIGKMGENMLLRIRSELFAHLQKLSLKFFDTADTGDIISRVTNDTDSIGQAFTSGVIQVLSDILSLVLIIGVMLSINVQLTLASLLVVPLIVIFALIFNPRFRKAYRATRTKISGVTSKLEESISGIRVIKSFTKEREVIEDFEETNLQDFKAGVQATVVSASFQPIILIIEALGSGIVMIYGGMLAFQGALGPPEDAIGIVITFLMYVGRFFGPISDLARFYNTVQSALAAAERVFELSDIQPEIVDSEDATVMPPIKGEIAFENVTFGYESQHPVLHNISFHIEPHEAIALVGPTGAGKSTIIKLLSRFYEPQMGLVKIDKRDVRDVTQESLRKQMGIVLQDTLLFTGTIMENLRYGKPNATDEEVTNATRILGANDFITKLPEGYNTKIGEKGAGLSVGQKQLISFVRALLRDPAILILDEATSSIDPYTDLLIRRAMKVLLKNRTSVIIAHRLSTVRNADRILVIDEGKIVEEGTHKNLMQKGGLYHHFYQMQFKEPETSQKTPN